MDSGEAVDGVGAVDDPPFFDEAAVSKYAAELIGVPPPSWSYRVVERRCGARCVGRLRRNQYRCIGTKSISPQLKDVFYAIRRDVYQAEVSRWFRSRRCR
jgi:hypothetical protein